METQETELLSEAGLVLADPFARKLVQANTKALYRQSKFNLLREDSEGYAKLLTLLHSVPPQGPREAALPGMITELRALVGFFELDPNR